MQNASNACKTLAKQFYTLINSGKTQAKFNFFFTMNNKRLQNAGKRKQNAGKRKLATFFLEIRTKYIYPIVVSKQLKCKQNAGISIS